MLFGVMSVACTPLPGASELAGTYVLSLETDTLHLDASGRYTRVFGRSGAPQPVAIDTGRWRVSNNGRLVSLAGLPRRWTEHGRFDPKSGTWHQPDTTLRGTLAMQIRVTWTGDVTLDVKPELGWRYIRLQPK
jgi:hypothetical protein